MTWYTEIAGYLVVGAIFALWVVLPVVKPYHNKAAVAWMVGSFVLIWPFFLAGAIWMYWREKNEYRNWKNR